VIAQNKDDIYIVDYRLGAYNGLELLRGAINNGCSYAFILLTGQGYREMDIKAMKAGAVDYFEKSQLIAP
jgi:FixJ family two-component response regulator